MTIEQKRICKICGKEKPIVQEEIRNGYAIRNFYRNICIECRKEQDKINIKNWKINNKEKVEEYKKRHLHRRRTDIQYKEKIYKRQRERRIERMEKSLLTQAKQRSDKKGFEFNLTIEDIIIPTQCPILNILIIPNSGKNSPSVDRVDNTKGYVKGNVRIISSLANTMKSSATKEELLAFAKNIKDYLNG
jgi:hypothetical protein